MLRKITFALVAAASMGTAALAPTSASAAWIWNGWGGYYDTWTGWPPGYVYYPTLTNAETIAYCARRFKSYDPANGTFLGKDGLRHTCM